MPYVVTAWKASPTPEADGTLVRISGREAGLISFLLSLVKIEPRVTIRVTGDTIFFDKGSLAGYISRVIPLRSISSCVYGYTKPWQTSAAIAGFAVMVSVGIGQAGGAGAAAFAVLLGLVIAAAYYFLNKTLMLGFVEDAGVISAIDFKRSVIENQNITEVEAAQVIALIQKQVDRAE